MMALAKSFPFRASVMALAVAAAAQSQAQKLEEVVVTAQARAESLQDVSISMIAMSGETIKDFGITRGEEFAADMPAVTIAQNPIGNFVFIRGIGTPGANQGIDQSVSIFHDGVYMGRHQLSRAPFFDLDRVEVLRGPQSILFGKNTIGGAISVHTAKPTEEFEGMISGLYGSYGEQELTGVLSGPITDTLRGRLAVRGYQMDGYVDNVMTGNDGPERDDQTIRAQLAWDATDNLTITAKWEQSDFEQVQQTTQLAVFNPFDAGAAATSGLNQALVAVATGTDGVERYDEERAVINDGGALLGQVVPLFAGLPGFPDKPEFSDNSMDVGQITLDWAIGDHTLTSITGYASYDYRDICDCDFAALPLIEVDATEDYSQFSQEVRLVSAAGEKLEYIVGFYYQESDLEYRSDEAFGSTIAFGQVGVPTPLLVPNLSRGYGMDQDQDMWAVFGSVTYSFTDQFRSIVGLRYFEENKTVNHFLNKSFTGGWDYSALVGAPAGTLAYGDTAAEYDRFLSEFGTVDVGGGITPGFLTEAVYGGLLGTFEHDIRGRDRNETDVNYQITLEYDLSMDTMVFATVSNGTKGGGFDARFLRTNDNPFFEYDEEKAQNYEIGIKSTLLDGGMTLNATAFMTTVEDYQVSIFDGATAFFVQNVGEIESKGLEVDLRWAATDQLTVSFAGAYLDATYSQFPNAPCWATSVDPVRGDCVNARTPTAFRDAEGDRNSFSPELSFNLNLDYRQPITQNIESRFTLNVNYSDDMFVAADLDPIYAAQDAFTKFDARIGLGSVDGQWEIALIGKNLSNEITSTGNSNDQPLVNGNGFAQTDRLRSYMAQATWRF